MTGIGGAERPRIIYGTAWKKGATAELVFTALSAGFRALDTANNLLHYAETAVGEGLRRARENGVMRDDVFLQSKFSPLSAQSAKVPYDPRSDLEEQVEQSFESSLSHLGTGYLDAYLLHGPYGHYRLEESDFRVWRAMEGLCKQARTRLIGVSNFNLRQLKELLDKADIPPHIVQNRCLARMGWDSDVRECCLKNNIMYQGFSLLTGNDEVVHHPLVRRCAAAMGRTAPQVVYRCAIQLGIVPLSGTTNKRHMEEDLAVLDFELSEDLMLAIRAIHRQAFPGEVSL